MQSVDIPDSAILVFVDVIIHICVCARVYVCIFVYIYVPHMPNDKLAD